HQMRNGDGLLVRASGCAERHAAFSYVRVRGDRVMVVGPWSYTFFKGGPALHEPQTIPVLLSWTALDVEGGNDFSGTARYTRVLELPDDWDGDVLLDLGTVKESARVLINGVAIDTLIGPKYVTVIDRQRFTGSDTLQVEVSNLMANRVADLDRRGVFWKRFYNVNFPARLAENRRDGLFTAAHWAPLESGLLGPVSITPVARLSD